MRAVLAAAVIVVGAATQAVAAGAVDVGNLVIRDAWVRASLGAAPNSAAYMTIEATGDAADRLVGAQSPAAERVELHTTVMEDGIARMRPLDAVDVAPGASAALEPGGHHLMLLGLTGRLEEGATIPLTLTFERAGSIELEVPVRGLAQGMKDGSDNDQHGRTGTE